MIRIAELQDRLHRHYPPGSAQGWDRVGLVTGDVDDQLRGVLLTVDVTDAVIEQAIRLGANLIIAHHPLLLRGVNAVDPAHPKGRMITSLIRHRIALITAHTNADIPAGGVAESLAAALGLADTRPLQVIEVTESTDAAAVAGMGRIGRIEPITLAAFAERVAAVLPATAGGVRVAGDPDRTISTVALQGGAGDDLLDLARQSGADVYLTSDLRHHPASEAVAWKDSPALIDVSHWAAEWIWLPPLQTELQTQLADPAIKITVSELRTDPWDFVVARPTT
ncbi:Nif3-like dinuclear metal center hexameric protein [Microlunatus elymi]|uniref:GTP cyclohydrolase 1 type 2 homolog n=1 Tax=Microlunatus elymi TaxID=2596828 RepID=A0A516PXI5_9ACTN|nr:Nif3-like dinuclear metal center hexameric protein [Microlunatus elymi]QDP95876.1 Nif3-like dinuclear metal center hexameric protein [Microlunatus elymi]